MPCGLTNALVAFQSSMDHISDKQSRKFFLVFYDNILINNKAWEGHFKHTDKAQVIMETQTLYANKGLLNVNLGWQFLYLGHIISANGV